MSVLDATDYSLTVGGVSWSNYMVTPLPSLVWSDSDGWTVSINIDASLVAPPAINTIVLLYQASVLRFRGVVSAVQTSDGIHIIYGVDAIAKIKANGVDYVKQAYNTRTATTAAVTVSSDRARITESGLILDGSMFMSIFQEISQYVDSGSRQDTYSLMANGSTGSDPNYTVTTIIDAFDHPVLDKIVVKMELDTNQGTGATSASTWILRAYDPTDGWSASLTFIISASGTAYFQENKTLNFAAHTIAGTTLQVSLECTNFTKNYTSPTLYHKCGPWVGSDARLSISDSDGDSASDYGMQMWLDGEEYKRVTSFGQEGAYYYIEEVDGVDDPVEEVRSGTICKYAVISGTVSISSMLINAGSFYGFTITAPSAVQNVLSYYVFRGKYLYDVFKSLLDIPQTAGSWEGYRCAIRGSLATTGAMVIRRIREITESSSYTFYPGDNYVFSANIINKVGGKTSQLMLKSSTEYSNSTKTRTLMTCIRGPAQSIMIQSSQSQSDLKTINDLHGAGVGMIKDAQSSDISGTLELDGLVWGVVDYTESSDTYGDGAIISYYDTENNLSTSKAKVLKAVWDLDKMRTVLTLGHLDAPSISKLSLVDMDRTDSSATKDSIGRYVGYCAVNATITGSPTTLRVGTATGWSAYVSGLLTIDPWSKVLHVEIPSTVFHAEGSHAITRIGTPYQTISLASAYYMDLTEDMDMLIVELWQLT